MPGGEESPASTGPAPPGLGLQALLKVGGCHSVYLPTKAHLIDPHPWGQPKFGLGFCNPMMPLKAWTQEQMGPSGLSRGTQCPGGPQSTCPPSAILGRLSEDKEGRDNL